MMADPTADQFKVWPTSLDRPQFVDVMSSESRDTLETTYPRIRARNTHGATTLDPGWSKPIYIFMTS